MQIMQQISVKIIGLEVKQALGILKAHRLQFDKDNKLIVFKGEVGAGKTTEQKALQIGTLGTKTLSDKQLYGNIETETQLLDGDLQLWVGCKSTESGGLDYVLYTKDYNGKIVKNPIVDGVKATPAKYLELLQTKLTWRMDELTSENPNTQRDILLDLYQYQLQAAGVIFDKKHPDYNESVLGRLDKAASIRDYTDSKRKELGGIAEDLKLKGVHVDRPETVPDWVDLAAIDAQILELEKELAVGSMKFSNEKQTRLSDVKSAADRLITRAIEYNSKLQNDYNTKLANFNLVKQKNDSIDSLIENLKATIEKLAAQNIMVAYTINREKNDTPTLPVEPILIKLEFGRIIDTDRTNEIVNENFLLREKYLQIENEPLAFDATELKTKIDVLKVKKNEGAEINKIVLAVDSFHSWREANESVIRIKDEYFKMLSKVDTGVDGLKITVFENDLFLTYDGTFDPKYFNNLTGEFRKLSSYSGTQKPVIALLVQNYLLSQKPKALRYMYIDNLPIDNKTRALLEKICTELDITVFLNLTGDFTREGLQPGEVLIENGEVFFK